MEDLSPQLARDDGKEDKKSGLRVSPTAIKNHGLAEAVNSINNQIKTENSVLWSENYSVGIQKFDDQHKKLFALIGQLSDGIKEGKGKYDLGSILDELQEYTSKHFLAEEVEMMSKKYPDYQAHKKEHEELKAQVRDFYSKFYSGEAELEESILTFLNDWLVNHIAKVDKQYGPYLKDA